MSDDPKRMFGPDGREWSFATNAPHEPSPVARACDGCAAPIGGVTRLCDTCLVVVSCGPKHILDRIDGADDEIARLRTENASLLARVEQAERERDDANARRDLACAALLMVGSELCGDPKIDPEDRGDARWSHTLREARALRADRDAWKAKAEARPEISRRDCARYVEYHQSMGMADDVHEPMKRIDAALRAHARKAVTG